MKGNSKWQCQLSVWLWMREIELKNEFMTSLILNSLKTDKRHSLITLSDIVKTLLSKFYAHNKIKRIGLWNIKLNYLKKLLIYDQ